MIINPAASAPASQRFIMFYAGANTLANAGTGRPAGTPYYGIGLAYSADGVSFTRIQPGLGSQPGLVLPASSALFGPLPGTYGDGVLADPSVVAVGTTLHLWCTSYAETTGTTRSPLAFGIAHAVSNDDGQTWTFPQANPLASLYRPGALGGGQQPSVIQDPRTGGFEDVVHQ